MLTFTNETPKVIYEQSFDAWGRYRNTEDWGYEKVQHRPRWMYRGYTGHEHLYGFVDVPGLDFGDYYACEYIVRPHDAFNLINMNGRLYDPVNGRMLSVDELSHDGLGTQGYNRYTYAHNNPLKYTDPDGENPMLIAVGVGATLGVITNGINNMKSGQKFFKGAGQAALSGAIFGGLTFSFGQIFQGLWLGQALAHGVLGAVQSGASGGSFRSGFMSGIVSSGVSSLVGSVANSLHFNASQTAASMIFAGGVSGGISSHMSGGSFLDGVKQGLMTSSLNHALHTGAKGIADELKNSGPIHRRIAVTTSGDILNGEYGAVDIIDEIINGKASSMTTYRALLNANGLVGYQKMTAIYEIITQSNPNYSNPEYGSSEEISYKQVSSTPFVEVKMDQVIAAVGTDWFNAYMSNAGENVAGYPNFYYDKGGFNVMSIFSALGPLGDVPKVSYFGVAASIFSSIMPSYYILGGRQTSLTIGGWTTFPQK